MRLLLVEDEKRLADALSHILKKEGYLVETALDGKQGMDMATTGLYDIIILDRMLPVYDGLTILKQFRALGFSEPVIFLTAKDTPKDKVDGLDCGADDYLVKPFSVEELLARIRSLLRRREKELVKEKISVSGFVLDPMRCEVINDDNVIKLTAKESMLLEILMRNCGMVITKERLLEKIWGYCTEIDSSNVDLYIHYLRKKLNTNLIITVRKVGYYLQKI